MTPLRERRLQWSRVVARVSRAISEILRLRQPPLHDFAIRRRASTAHGLLVTAVRGGRNAASLPFRSVWIVDVEPDSRQAALSNERSARLAL